MERNIYRKSEVLAYLEEKILMNMATEDEQTLYEGFVWNGKLVKNYTLKKLIAEMRRLYDEKF